MRPVDKKPPTGKYAVRSTLGPPGIARRLIMRGDSPKLTTKKPPSAAGVAVKSPKPKSGSGGAAVKPKTKKRAKVVSG